MVIKCKMTARIGLRRPSVIQWPFNSASESITPSETLTPFILQSGEARSLFYILSPRLHYHSLCLLSKALPERIRIIVNLVLTVHPTPSAPFPSAATDFSVSSPHASNSLSCILPKCPPGTRTGIQISRGNRKMCLPL